MTTELLSGWGRTAPSAAEVVDAVDDSAVAGAVRGCGARGVLARGLGRSYGDAAQNGGGTVVRLGDSSAVSLDSSTGLVRAGAGVSLETVIASLLPQGFFVPVTPGTRLVTLGGAIAADIHGKNHHVDGSFGNHLESLDLMGPDGTIRTVGPNTDPEAFWATVGGMGLTGIVTACTFRALAVETSKMLVETWRTSDLDETMRVMEEHESSYRYSVAWIDALGTGARLGRGVVTMAEHAPASAVPLGTSREFTDSAVAGVPSVVPSGLLNSTTIRAFNELWYRKAPRRRSAELQGISAFFHPLDLVRNWNRLYGRRGMLQYQFVIPLGAETLLRSIMERLAHGRAASFLTVLKRFGPSNAGMLSFPAPGWTLTLDIPTGVSGLGELLHGLDHDVVGAGGRVYFAKDSRVSPALVPQMYPRLDEWRAVCDRLDPTAVFQSDLSRRLGLRRANTVDGAPSGTRE